MIDPCLQHRRDIEIIHRRFKDDDVTGQYFGDQCSGQGQFRCIRICIEDVDKGRGNVRDGILNQIVHYYFCARISLFQAFYGGCADFNG